MTNFTKIICFFVFLSLFTTVQSYYSKQIQKANKPLSLQQFEAYYKAGIPVIDTRHVPQNGIIKGAYWISQNGIVSQLVSFVLKPGAQFVLVSNQPKRNETILKLIEGGWRNILGYNDFDMKEWKDKLIKPEIKTLKQLNSGINQAFIDVRSVPQLKNTGKIENSLWIEIQEFQSRIKQVEQFIKDNNDSQIIIHCKASPRARLASSIFKNKGLGRVTVLNEPIQNLKHMFVPVDKEDL